MNRLNKAIAALMSSAGVWLSVGGATAARLLIYEIEIGTYHQDQFCREVAARSADWFEGLMKD